MKPRIIVGVAAAALTATLSLSGCANEDAAPAPETSEQVQKNQPETATNDELEPLDDGSPAVDPPDFASETRPVPDVVIDAVGPKCGEATRPDTGKTYNIMAVNGGDRCEEAMEVVNDFVSEDTKAVKQSDDSWQAINDWRCGRGTRLQGEPTDAEDYTMNCWDGRTRVLFMEKHPEN